MSSHSSHCVPAPLGSFTQAQLLRPRRPLREFDWVHQHFFEFRALLRLTILDGGLILTSSYRVRHLMPTFPFIYLLVSREIGAWLETSPASPPGGNERSSQPHLLRIFKVGVITTLASWLVLGTLTSFGFSQLL